MASLRLPSGYHHIGRDELPARRVLLEGDLLRAVSAAQSYRGPRLSIEDLAQEGGTNPMKAVDKFGPDKNDRWCIRATWWIGQSMGRKPTSKEDG